jgi:hypothetical protein
MPIGCNTYIPNGHKMYHFPFQDPPKLIQIVIFVLKIYVHTIWQPCATIEIVVHRSYTKSSTLEKSFS